MLIRSFITFVIILLLNGCAINNGEKITQVATVAPRNIAIMLPLKGKGDLAQTSLAIRNGLLAAYYSSSQQSNIKIQIIDTSGGDVGALYNQAVASGAEIVIGPLTKPEVELVANIDPLPVPTIALNTLDDYQHKAIKNLYQFGLLPQDEAMQVATKMAQERFNDAAVITPESAWGDKVAAAFEGQYVSHGGRVVATLKYNTDQNLAEQVCNFLANDPAEQCVPRKNKNKKHKDPNEIMRRQDINAIFLVATTPAQARQIVPLLKYYYAGDLPIYSISTIYSGVPRPDLDQDINDVYFCDMPWVIQSPASFNNNLQAIYKQITTTAYSKFYALGIDAYNLAVGLNTMLGTSQGKIEGASGTLYLDRFNHVYRQLMWTQMKNGVIK